VNQALLSSAKMTFMTPPKVVEVIKRFRPIVLDPTANPTNNVGASYYHTEETDSLTLPWSTYGLNFSNPPFGRMLPKFTRKFREESGLGREVLGLTPARMDTVWWRDIATADAVVCWRGRITFWEVRHSDADGADRNPAEGTIGPAMTWSKKARVWRVTPAPFPVAFSYWGPSVDDFCEVFAPYSNWTVRKCKQGKAA
jgi:phage N-6-adenine-methyltransferase